MNLVCPCCATKFPLEAGFAEGDAKRLSVLFGDMEPAIARACIGYLRLFKPAKQELRVNSAIAIITDVAALINAGSVSRDERTGLYRPTTPTMWAQGMEQMQTQKLELPLKSHGYLRAIVFAIADSADAKAELQREQQRRVQGRAVNAGMVSVSPLSTHLQWLADQLRRGAMTQADHDSQVEATRKKYEAQS